MLREAAALTTNATLKNFLSKRADAFGSDDYYDSDVAWMELDSPIDVTIGPYETYEDELFSYKAAFEAYVTLRDDAETAKLAKFSGHLQELENNLPIDPRYRNPKLGAASPIRVVNEVFGSGEGNSGVQTAAFNLPNDERVVKEKGSKRVMLKNVQDAKFNKTLIPISRVVLDPAEQSALAFESFFTHILCHELMHGLGPHNITVNGQETTVRKQLKELYSAIEEAKADMTGLWALQYMIDRGIIEKSMERTLYTTYLASMFRSVRFGITEAHGRGVAMQFNYLTDEGAIKFNEAKGTFSIDHAKIKEAVTKLTRELLTLEAEGSYDKAKAILDKFAVIRPPMQQALDKLKMCRWISSRCFRWRNEDLSRKGAKLQSAAAFLNGFLCAFAPLRGSSCFELFAEEGCDLPGVDRFPRQFAGRVVTAGSQTTSSGRLWRRASAIASCERSIGKVRS